MNRKQKINLLNQFELGHVPVEIFHPVTIKFSYRSIKEYKAPSSIVNDEDKPDIETSNCYTKFGINPYTDKFYGKIEILIVN